MDVDGFRIDTAVHIPRVTSEPPLPARHLRPGHLTQRFGTDAAQSFFVLGEAGAFLNDKWNRGSVNHSAQSFTWKERKEYSADDETAAIEQFTYENNLGTGNQPTSR